MKHWNRRRFLSGMGAALVAAPVLGLLERDIRAENATPARRLVVFFSPNGTIHKHWRPSGSGSNFSFPAGSILEPLAAHKSRIIVCDGLDFHGVDNHEAGMAAMLTGGGTLGTETAGKSLDQYIAHRIGQNDRFPSLELGVQTSAWGGGIQTRMSYAGPGQFVPPDDSPKSVYTRMFGDALGGPGELDAALARKKSILDLLRGELGTLRGKVGAHEREKLDEHLASLKKIESGLQGPLCAPPAAPPAVGTYSNDAFPTIGKSQMDLLVLALACDMTRVASVQWNHTVGPVVMSWLGVAEGHHGLSHSDDGNSKGVAEFVATERWYAEQFAYLLERLATTADPQGGMLLDSTVVLWCKELGDSRLHDCKSVPFVLAGGGGLSTGRYLNFGGAPHNRLLVSVCQALGLDNETFGDPQKGSGPLPELFA
ncbi:DUF1552 domain-containing protein [Polyangium fumosum]|uniref:DUF1552 domain-containing protein n=1 Tax=Polyangium fumosum TaxID=889272 RepID=A0A4U1JEF9_9BACT|nr:DUF1552 domain-containing protein [Polyangium fumosum]TKD09474.1 DUF1552 domain-containing protein [Polyangium fumosum]